MSPRSARKKQPAKKATIKNASATQSTVTHAAGKGASPRTGTAGRDNAKTSTGNAPNGVAIAPLVQLHAGTLNYESSARTHNEIIRLCADWSYTLRMRNRWSHDADLRVSMSEYAVEALAELGFDEKTVRQLATSTRLEVILADAVYPADMIAAAFAFPWEYVLNAATRCLGRTQSVLITRCLAGNGESRPDTLTRGPLTIVTSAPGRIAEIYGFDSEILRLAHAFEVRETSDIVFPPTDRAKHTTPQRSTRTALKAHMLALPVHASHFVHVSGVDPIQAAALLPDLYDAPSQVQPGGMMMAREVPTVDQLGPTSDLRREATREQVVHAGELASALIPAGSAPALVTLNLHYSGAHTAPEMLRHGALASVGFLDTIPDEVAEYFFAVFYRECRTAKALSDIANAFGSAWAQLDEQDHDLHGTGIVLWMCKCDAVPTGADRSVTVTAASVSADALDRTVVPETTTADVRQSRRRRLSDVLAVDVAVPSEINYSLLHNRRSAIKTFTLSKLVDHELDDVRIEVELEAGGIVQQFRRTISLREPHVALADTITLPLTAPLLRSLQERTHTTVYTRVTWEGRVAHEETHRVALLPVDEWYDDTKNNPWLPSFVLPRDPAVARIIGDARKYLIALTDDPNAGFDGYQQVDDPESGKHATDRTDLQVQAIWTALVNERKLLYINPPPAYSRGGQRLRTPSEMLHTSSGTCIDLSLLLAACLEYVEIHACLVLLTGHCFVGYWRADAYQQEFMTVARPPEGRLKSLGELAFRSGRIELVDSYGWRVGPQGYDELQGYVRTDALCLLEATGLCFSHSFGQAIQEGLENLTDRNAFDSLLDIRVARCSSPPVTPLPILAGAR